MSDPLALTSTRTLSTAIHIPELFPQLPNQPTVKQLQNIVQEYTFFSSVYFLPLT